MVEELAQTARGAGPSRLLPVDVIHRLVHEKAKRTTKVQP